ncbi:hypothetical protein FRB94_011010 [Tulasnella sp. JGI-2019a]|nr:hypothetical protein FRB93_000580 [Tulasnella sp. JGI-2019a]KAG9010033.1 hypothetical protein FRB94_011010 [Tulasnella sp. JGI-2019a]KAG9028778.1 hypothetical protein FRB95_006105 [Tulasnella sp. JGI-2019a]
MPAKRQRSESDEVEQDEIDDEARVDGSPVPALTAQVEPVDGSVMQAPVKNRRGRPPGSKNKKSLDASEAAANTEAGPSNAPPPIKRPRGRPRKPRTEEQLAAEAAKAAMPKRPRGRPKKLRAENGTVTEPATAVASTSNTVVPALPSPPTPLSATDRTSLVGPSKSS